MLTIQLNKPDSARSFLKTRQISKRHLFGTNKRSSADAFSGYGKSTPPLSLHLSARRKPPPIQSDDPYTNPFLVECRNNNSLSKDRAAIILCQSVFVQRSSIGYGNALGKEEISAGKLCKNFALSAWQANCGWNYGRFQPIKRYVFRRALTQLIASCIVRFRMRQRDFPVFRWPIQLKRRMYPLGALSNANGFFGDDADILGRLICPRGPLRIWQRRPAR